jgi:hypothetical protein
MGINLTQEFAFETDSIESLHKMLSTICEIVFREGFDEKLYLRTVSLGGWNDGSNNDQKPLNAFILMLGNDKHSYQEGLDVCCCSIRDMVKQAMDYIKKEDIFSLTSNLRPVPYWFDGSVEPGYRVHLEHHAGNEEIFVSAVNILYGK